MHICKSLCLNHIRSIEDELLRFCHVACEEEMREMHAIRSSFDALDVSTCPPNGFNFNRYNSLDERLSLKYFKMIRQ